MLFPNIPFTEKVRRELRKALTSHPGWREYRSMNAHLPNLSHMSRDQLLTAVQKLGMSVPELVERSGAQTNRIYRKSVTDDVHAMRTAAVAKLQDEGYTWASGRWLKFENWD